MSPTSVAVLMIASSAVCTAQQADTTFDRCMIGIGWGATVPMGKIESSPADLMQRIDLPPATISSVIFASYPFTRSIRIEAALTIGINTAESRVQNETYRKAVEEEHRDRFFLSVNEDDHSTVSVTVGPVYRFVWTKTALDLGFAAGFAHHTFAAPTILTKEQGSNIFIETIYERSEATSIIVHPVAMFHYSLHRTFGMLARLGYLHADVTGDQSVHEQRLAGDGDALHIERSYIYRTLSFHMGLSLML